MELILLRHGEAEFSSPDSARQLTANGKQQVIKMAQTYRQSINGIELVLTSPMQRALETTQLFMGNAEIACDFRIVDFLLPDSSVNLVKQQIQTFDNEKILMVGHLPLLDYWIDYLTGNNSVTMATASLASLTMDYAYKGMATINWNYHVD